MGQSAGSPRGAANASFMASRPFCRRWAVALSLLGATLLLVASPASGVDPPIQPVTAQAETTPVPGGGDATDDPAIWVHPTDRSKSLVFGSDKNGGLESYNLDGTRVQRISEGFFGNVDVRYGFPLGNTVVDIVVVSRSGIRLYKIDPVTRLLTNITDGGSISSSGEGLCLYHSARDGRFYAFHVNRSGGVRQVELRDADHNGRVDGHLVRSWSIGSESEGCVADDEAGYFFVSEEDVGVWRYGAEPGDPTSPAARTSVDTVGAPGHIADAEGLTIVPQAGGGGYLLASAQGSSNNDGVAFVTVYRRQAPQFVKRFQVVAGAATDGCGRTDGIDATPVNLGPLFPSGLFVCQDNSNTAPGSVGNQNFKLVRLEQALDLGPQPPGAPVITSFTSHPTPTPSGDGYWMAATDGRVFAFGAAEDHGEAASPPAFPVVGMAATPDGGGYWLVTARGQVLRFGNAGALGDVSGVAINRPIVGMAATPTGQGYWLVASDGGVFTFGDAPFRGSLGGIALNKPVVGMAGTPTGQGYWLVASDGGVFTFGDAPFRGSTGGVVLNRPITGMAATPSGQGYWLVAADGGVFSFNAPFHGSTGAMPPGAPAVGMAATPDGGGYWLAGQDGAVFDFGNADDFGSP
jgi:myo-inositol-hexaphosphate 3-phosphohydrolase